MQNRKVLLSLEDQVDAEKETELKRKELEKDVDIELEENPDLEPFRHVYPVPHQGRPLRIHAGPADALRILAEGRQT